jgi:hypothetical protein
MIVGNLVFDFVRLMLAVLPTTVRDGRKSPGGFERNGPTAQRRSAHPKPK